MKLESFGRDMPADEERKYASILENTTSTEDFTDHPEDLKNELAALLELQELEVTEAMQKVSDLNHMYRKAPEFGKIFETDDIGATIDSNSNMQLKPEVIKELNSANEKLKEEVTKRNTLKENLERVIKLTPENPELN